MLIYRIGTYFVEIIKVFDRLIFVEEFLCNHFNAANVGIIYHI